MEFPGSQRNLQPVHPDLCAAVGDELRNSDGTGTGESFWNDRVFGKQLLLLFVRPTETEILAVGVQYLRIEGSFYCLIGFLFLFYGFYRAMNRPGISVVLTVISLGSRVALAYGLSAIPAIGVTGIWAAVPLGWLLADAVGLLCLRSLYRNSIGSS